MKRFLWIFWVIPVFFNIQESFANIADANDEIVEEKAIDPLLKRYVKQAEAAADKMEKYFNYYSGRVFAKIYSHYFNDVEVIARQGTAPDNPELYEDLEMMNNSRPQLFYQNKKAAFEK
ncbi:MAG: hypothetical protein IJ479_02020 [Alphaproteobacteria bacterium]|nr:hypothetical protein [Alphaproteobacteria bacterium]